MTNIDPSQHSHKDRFYGYFRVSIPKQGEGVSLLTQREEIARFAEKRGLLIVGWFGEKETAAKRGRSIFGEVPKILRKGDADGLIVHKVDRSARNLKVWAELGELIDSGIPVYFAGEGIVATRSGRLRRISTPWWPPTTSGTCGRRRSVGSRNGWSRGSSPVVRVSCYACCAHREEALL